MTGLQARLRKAAATVLRVPAARIAADAPLARYGLDSLNAVELAAAVSEIAGVEFADEQLVECASIAAIAAWLEGGACASPTLALMRADSVLPADVLPGAAPAPRGALLVTGGTGFLGKHLLGALLRESTREIVCLVRAPDDAAAQRRLGIRDPRLRAIAADLEQPRLGLPAARYTELRAGIASIFHCAAAVDWSLGYESLRTANVLPTLELLRLASDGPRKAFHHVSSAATCYSARAPGRVREDAVAVDPAGIHLGYAQSKWVAEALVREARRRGLEASIYRPALIAGHSVTGEGNHEDFLASLIKGCIALGAAPQLQWRVDACPVDFVARAIAHLSGGAASTFHLVNPRRAFWAEAVLWMNLRGHRVRLLPFEQWIERVDECSRDPRHPLHRLRGFLLYRPSGEGGRYLAQLYGEERLGAIDDAATRARLAAAGLECPRLEPALLGKWFDAYERTGFLPPARRARSRGGASADDVPAQLEDLFGERFDVARRFDLGGESSILGELASWHAGSAFGLCGYVLEVGGRRRAVVLKPKPGDERLREVACEVAALCDPALGVAFERHWHRTALAGTARREIALYQSEDAVLRAYSPACHGVISVARGQALVLEHVADLKLNDASARWQSRQIETALDGIALVHARAPAPGVAARLDARAVAETHELWLALAEHAEPLIRAWGGRGLAALAQAAVRRAQVLEDMPQALIHHDFNPRNIGLRQRGGAPLLCALDWELAASGVPQRDLAELLCFVLEPQSAAASAMRYVERHRLRLERASGQRVDREQWLEGFHQALRDFAVQRLTMYCLAHRFRPQPYLERVTRTWWQLANAALPAKELQHAAA